MQKKRSSARGGRFNTKKTGSNSPNFIAVGLIIVSVLLLMSLGYFYFNQPKSLDAQLCPADGPDRYALILLDLTDPVTAQQASSIEGLISDYIQEARPGSFFSVGSVGADGEKLTPLFQMCKPPTGSDASPLTSNPRMITEKYRDVFLIPLTKKIKGLITNSGVSLPTSPILESMQSLIAQSPGFQRLKGQESKERDVLVVSDLMQHSKLFSFYRNDDWNAFVRRGLNNEVSSSLAGASVTFFEITRNMPPKVLEVRAGFWNKYFDQAGVAKIKHVKIGTL